jgi:UDP-2,3-diacylglucosamine hydrolase
MVDSLEQPGGLGRAELVVVSDVHLRQPDDRRCRLLVNLVRQLGQTTEYFVLNGDIFDFCFGDSSYFRDKFQELGEALQTAVKQGIKVVFIEGNHEFHMECLGWNGIEIVKEHSRTVTLRSGTTIKIGHGDLITDDRAYRAFRGLIKSDFVRGVAKRVPGRWLDAYALKHAKVSRGQDRYRKLDHHRILAAFSRFLSDGDYHHGIIGHFHVPYAEKRETADGLMLSVESWDQPNALTFDTGSFYRVFFDIGAPAKIEPAESIFREGSMH